ncbi:MAG: hypothetical protein M1431_00030 [Candidatus Thermoplasmatota archaeon]|nr:hypothetical protein [Candidatus Thermoplasmatota archaeon]
MTPFRLIAGLILLLVGAILYSYSNIEYSLIVLIVGIAVVGSSFAGSTGRIRKRVNRITSDGIKEAGLSRVKAGKLRVSEETFNSVMNSISDVLANQAVMPEFGLDSIYLNFAKMADAEKTSDELTRRGLKNDVMQEKSSWKVRILF